MDPTSVNYHQIRLTVASRFTDPAMIQRRPQQSGTQRRAALSSSGQQWEGKTILTGRNSQYLLRLVQVEGRKMGPNTHCGSVERLFPTDLSQQGKHRARDCHCSAQEM